MTFVINILTLTFPTASAVRRVRAMVARRLDTRSTGTQAVRHNVKFKTAPAKWERSYIVRATGLFLTALNAVRIVVKKKYVQVLLLDWVRKRCQIILVPVPDTEK